MGVSPRRSGERTRESDAELLLQTITALIAAETWAESKRILEQHPELLSEQADALLEQLITVETDEQAIGFHTEIRELLRRCRVTGVEGAFAPLLQPPTPGELSLETPVGFEAEVQELRDLAGKAQQDPRLHLQRIVLIKDMLLRIPPDQSPTFRGVLLNDLGTAYTDLPTGNQAENLQQAIACYQEALRFWTPEVAPMDYAITQYNLGLTYAGLPSGDRTENLMQAIACYQEALRFWTPEAAPMDYAMTQHDLGEAYAGLPTGNQAENLTRAIACYQEALRFRTPESAPLDYAATQNNLGAVYAGLPIRDRTDNLTRAIACYQEALRFWTPETAPLDYAVAQNNLGAAHRNLPTGNQAESLENLEKAIACYQEALRFWTPETAPLDYAKTQNNLGLAYAHLPTSDRTDNLKKAIACYQEALHFWTPETAPLDYAVTQNNLGLAYVDLPTSDRTDNLKKAIACYQEALRIRTPGAAPADHRRTARNLGDLHFGERHWGQAHNAYVWAIDAGEALYQVSATEVARQAELAEARDLFPNDAYCLARLGHFTEAVERLEAGKARALAEALAQDRAALAQANPADRVAFAAARERIRALEVETRTLGAAVTDAGGARQFMQISSDLNAARRELAAVVKCIQAYLPEFMPAALDFQAIAAAAAPACPLVYLITTSQGSLGLIVPTRAKSLDAKHCVWLDYLRADDLSNLLVQKDIRDVTGDYLVAQVLGDVGLVDDVGQVMDVVALLQTALDRALPVLHERLAGPLAARLLELGFEQAVLIPGGRLTLLPLPAAAFETINFSLSPSARALQAARQALEERVGLPHVLLGVGNPLPSPRPLRFARAEVEAISPLFPTGGQRLLPERKATRANTLKKIAGATHLHFACHGAFNMEEPLDSALFLAGHDTLTLRDLLDGDLDLSKARLAVLSACQTGITDFRRVPDEAVGLPAGFLQAGVPGVISTLWPVNDPSTAVLMRQFYDYHLEKAQDPATALHLAQALLRTATADEMGLAEIYERVYQESGRKDMNAFKWMRYYQAKPGVKPFDHPYYWAAFVFSGVGQ